ncbi:hypothetical protein Tco_1242144, partial [Tanacetum coccineum]
MADVFVVGEGPERVLMMLVGLQRVCHVRIASFEPCQYGIRLRPRGLVYLLYIIKSPQSSMPIACDIIACG